MLDAIGSGMAAGVGALAVPEAATAFVLAGLCTLSERRPLLVVTPTLSDAERMAHDLESFLGDDSVELFPPWDTLPFERVSPEITTMGQRLRLLWRLGIRSVDERTEPVAGTPPSVVVAPVRALLQRLGPVEDAVAPLVVVAGDQLDQSDFVARLAALGYRREYQVEHRGELAVRGGIVDVFVVHLRHAGTDRLLRRRGRPSGSVRPGRPAIGVGPRAGRDLRLSRARSRRRSARQGPALVKTEPWGRSQWERIAEGQLFDGMESWTAWLVESEQVLPDLIGPAGRVVLVDPRRMRDRCGRSQPRGDGARLRLGCDLGCGAG